LVVGLLLVGENPSAIRPPHGLATDAGAVWSEDGFNGAHTGFNSSETVIGPHNVSRLRLAWRAQTPAAMTPSVWSAVTVSGSAVYAGSSDGTWAFEKASGKPIWHDAWTGNTGASAPCFAGGRAYIGNARGVLYAIDPRNGHKEWAIETQPQNYPRAALTSPSAAADVIYVGSFAHGSFAVRSGPTLLWAAESGTHTTSPTVTRDTVYLGSSEGVQALGRDSGAGKPSWGTRFSVPSQTFSAPSASAQGLYVSATAPSGRGPIGFLYDLNRSSGSEVWRFPRIGARSRPLSQPAVGGGFVYVTASSGLVSRFDGSTGQRSWTFPASGSPPSGQFSWWRPSLADGVLYVGGVGRHKEMLLALSANTGIELWQHVWHEQFDGRAVSSSEPAVAGGWVFVSNSYDWRGLGKNAAGVYAFKVPDSSTRFRMPGR
jgi:outer membrane protein assembly factor BamB